LRAEEIRTAAENMRHAESRATFPGVDDRIHRQRIPPNPCWTPPNHTGPWRWC